MPAADVVIVGRASAVAALCLLVAQGLAICALALAFGAADPQHVAATASALTVEFAADHAHADVEPEHVPHEQHATYSLPRVDNPLRLLVAAVAVGVVVSAAVAWVITPSRAPPAVAVPARCGRRVLLRLCVDRC